MQLRFATDLSAEQYIRKQGWRYAKLDQCPLHPKGECGFARQGTYDRKFPDGTKIARWYCPAGHTTFSLLPDCLASRLPGSLIEVEEVIDKIENSPSQEAAAANLRLDIGLVGVMRWIRRRVFLVKAALTILVELLPSLPTGLSPTISSFRSVLGVEYALPELRIHAGSYLHILPPPLGFGLRPGPQNLQKSHFQHQTGTDPPRKRV